MPTPDQPTRQRDRRYQGRGVSKDETELNEHKNHIGRASGPSGPRIDDNVPVANRFLRPLNAARGVLLVIVVVLLIGHVARPSAVRIDPSTLALLFLATTLVLAPTLKSAKLPGAEFNFREEIEAAEELGEQVHARAEQDLTEVHAQVERELTEGPLLGWPGLFQLDDDLRQLAIDQPALALSTLRHEMSKGLHSAVRALSGNKIHPSSLEEMVSYVAASNRLRPEQAVLLKVLLDISESALMSGAVSSADAMRVIGVADVLNQSIRLGYSLDFDPNPDWEEQGLICQFEHCIENMPLPEIPRSEQERWRAHISKGLASGAYDDRPEVKESFERTLEEPIPDDAPEEVDETGSCPIFGHYCPGGQTTVNGCESAKEWVTSSEKALARKVDDSSQPRAIDAGVPTIDHNGPES
jgi:hypothetical protein